MYKVPLSKPSITEAEIEAVVSVMRSGQLAQGPKVEEFEHLIADYVGVKYAIAVSSGTAGLFLCLKACGIGPGDEVITSPYSFIASSNVIVHAGAKPVFVDIDRDTYNITPDAILSYFAKNDTDKFTKAVIPIDVFGNPADTNISMWSKYHGNSSIILDSCEALGSRMNRLFDAQVFAFYPNKQLTTGEGGIICTNSKAIAEYCRAARNQGRLPGDKWLESSIIGYNFRMTDIQAAIGIEQMKRIDEIKSKRQLVALTYHQILADLYISKKINWQEFPSNDINPFVFTIEVDNRDKVMQYLISQGIECKPYFPCIHLQKPYRDMGYHEGMYPVAEYISGRTLALPFFCDLSEPEIDFVCKTLKTAIKEAC